MAQPIPSIIIPVIIILPLIVFGYGWHGIWAEMTTCDESKEEGAALQWNPRMLSPSSLPAAQLI